jgi:hypothetical protein
MSNHMEAAIAELEVKLRAQQAMVTQTKQAINLLCNVAGFAERYPGADIESGTSIARIQPDTFYGRPLMSAMRDFLTMRKSQNLGAASVNEIHDALTRGGFKFETKNEENAKAGIRQSLTKNADVFHKLPTGDYGLLTWYPDAKVGRKSSAPVPTPEAKPRETEQETADAAGTSKKRFGWAAEIDGVLVSAPGPLKPVAIASALMAKHADKALPKNVGPIVRNTLATKANDMGWDRDAEGGWFKKR